VIDHLKDKYPVQMLCEVWDCPRSSYYHRSAATPDAPALVIAIEQILMRWPTYGYRRVHKQLAREGYRVGERVVRRILQSFEGSRNVGRVMVRTTNSRHTLPRYPNRIKGVTPKSINQIWVADITYIRLTRRFMYLAVILDAFSRGVRGWYLGRDLTKQLTVTALQNALSNHPAPAIFHSDQGSQYAAWLHTDILFNAGVEISMSRGGMPTDNALVERFIRTFKEEHVDYADYDDFDDAYRQIGHWLEVEYMTERIHSALDYLTPAEFEVEASQPTSPSFRSILCPIS
jgi:transposase InsO family protein